MHISKNPGHKLVKLLFWLLSFSFFSGTTLVLFGFLYMTYGLPNVDILNDIQLHSPLQVFSKDNLLIGEFGEIRRTPIPYEEIPQDLINAVLATEDRRYFEHAGVDFFGLARAAVAVIREREKVQGGSTITMQVARNFFLTREKTIGRKVREILLAIKIDKELEKEKILSLYLNKIYLGNRAYGVAAAAQVYYGKSLNELTLPQYAMIAGLPKAPSALNPLNNPIAAKTRRNHVLKRMLHGNNIDYPTYMAGIRAPLTAKYHGSPISFEAPYIAEMARQELIRSLGKKAYTSGLKVYTTIDSRLQQQATKSLQNGIINYEKRHGYRGAIKNLGGLDKNQTRWLHKLQKLPTVGNLVPAALLEITNSKLSALLANGQLIEISRNEFSWIYKKRLSNHLKTGDILWVRNTNNHWELNQLPKVEGSLVAIDPHDGAVLALQGGFDFDKSNFNRVTQASRQAGSAFKPFIFSAALADGYTLATTVNDAPFVAHDPSQNDLWRPQNNSRQFYGPTRLREALIKSRNLVSIRLLETMGIPFAIEKMKEFGFRTEHFPQSLSLALGTAAVSPMELARGFAAFANNGYRITPYFIDHIENSKGNVIFQAHPKLACPSCIYDDFEHPNDLVPPDKRAPKATSPQIAYLIHTALKDVIKRGTGRKAKSLNRKDIAGKTGTTNDQKDGWFAGYNPSIVTVVWVGFDKPSTLKEYGSQTALPIWINFMSKALENRPEEFTPQPPKLVSLRIDQETGYPADPWQPNSVFEMFREEHVPRGQPMVTSNDHYGAHDSFSNSNEYEPLF